MRSLLLLPLLLLSLLTPSLADELYRVGFRTVGQWLPEKNLRLDISVWYPSIRPPRSLQYPPWTITAARNGKPVPGRFPLLLLSHDTAGTRFSYHDTAAWLASCGFVVAAPAHAKDCMDNMENLLTWQQLQDRTDELNATIEVLLANSDTANSIDQERIGALGFGTGAAAVLLLGGALPDCSHLAQYCERSGAQDTIYCNHWGKKRMEALCQRLPLDKSLANPRIRAMAAIAPAFAMLFSRDSFRYFYPPLLLVAASSNSACNSAPHARHLYIQMPKKPRWLSLQQADPGALMAACPKSLQNALPEICRSLDDATRKAMHKKMHTSLGNFFLRYLGSKERLPQIPAPPLLKARSPELQSGSPSGKKQQKKQKNPRAKKQK